MVPAPGTLTVLAASDAMKDTGPTKKAARKKSAGATKTTSGKKATPDNTRSRTRAAKRPLINASKDVRLALAQKPTAQLDSAQPQGRKCGPVGVVVRPPHV